MTSLARSEYRSPSDQLLNLYHELAAITPEQIENIVPAKKIAQATSLFEEAKKTLASEPDRLTTAKRNLRLVINEVKRIDDIQQRIRQQALSALDLLSEQAVAPQATASSSSTSTADEDLASLRAETHLNELPYSILRNEIFEWIDEPSSRQSLASISKDTAHKITKSNVLNTLSNHPFTGTYAQLEELILHHKLAENLKSLDLSNNIHVNDEMVKKIAQLLPHLERIHLGGTAITGRSLLALSKHPLTELNIQSCSSLKGADFAFLGAFKRLQKLDLTGTKITDDSLKILTGLPKLTSLSLRLTEITNAGLDHVKLLPNLRELNLQMCRYLSTGALSGLSKKLIELNLTNANWLTNLDFIALKEMDRLRFLNLAGCTGLTDANFAELSACRNLTGLDLTGTNITGVGLKHLERLPLTDLNLRQCNDLEGHDFMCLKAHKNLISLNVFGTKISDESLLALKGLVALEKLDLGGTGVSAKGLAVAKHLSALKELSLQGCMNLSGLEPLEDCSNLVVLNLSSCEWLNDNHFVSLENLSELQTLNLMLCPRVNGIGIKNLKHLTELNLAYTYDLRQLPFISTLKKLEKLTLDGCVSFNDLRLIELAALPALHTLSLERNLAWLSDATCAKLRAFKHLQNLNLSNNNLTDLGLAQLQPLTGLRSLTLINTQLTDDCLPLLQQLKKLKTLALSQTEISAAGKEQLRGTGIIVT